MPKDRWQSLCDSVAQEDGLPVREVGAWTEEKLWFWNRYLEITTTSMVGHPKWPFLVYVDLFAGPGVCKLKGSKRRIPGSPLIAANAPKPFTSILLCEMDTSLAKACEVRLGNSLAQGRFTVFVGDCNDLASSIARAIPDRALSLAFVDPAGLDAKFETIRKLSARGRVDLLILFADAYDIVRNVDKYEANIGSKLDDVLGPDSNWRARWQQLRNRTGTNVRKLFAETYQDQLRKLDYIVFGAKTIKGARGPLYRLIYASKHPRGLDFWEKVTKKDLRGQLDLGF